LFIGKCELQKPYVERDVRKSILEWSSAAKNLERDSSLIKKDILETFFYGSIRWVKFFRKVEFAL
jgi:hypothetical protein